MVLCEPRPPVSATPKLQRNSVFAIILTGLRCAFQRTIALCPQLNVKNPVL